MVSNSVKFSILFFCASGVASHVAQEPADVHVRNVKSIFALSPSPVAEQILFYGSVKQQEGEVFAGMPFLAYLNGTAREAVQLKAPIASNPPAPVWQPDGRFAYFETDEGIYQLDPAGGEPQPFWKGSSDGIAISRNGLSLVFWSIARGINTLTVYDLKTKAETRAWRVLDRFEADKSGWDLAFSPDGHFVYARTYDEPNNTPLKRFDISNGKTVTVNPNCYAVVRASHTVYFIAASGLARSLFKIESGSPDPVLVAKEFNYDKLFNGGGARWLIAQDYRTKGIVLVDSQTAATKKIGQYDGATMLSDGRLVVVKGSELIVSAP